MIAFKQHPQQIPFLVLVLLHNASGTRRTGRACNPCNFLVQTQLLQQHVEPSLDLRPRTLVQVLLLTPLDICIFVLLDDCDDPAEVQWCELFDPDYG